MAKTPAVYPAKIDKIPLRIQNAHREEFRKKLDEIPFRGYEVETLSDGRKVCITKPGGKNRFGQMKISDFMVWIYDESKGELWRISHKEIFNDLEEKGKVNPEETIKIIDALERVFVGEEPYDILKTAKLNNPTGESPELLLKTYKWIWGQEDCNYPNLKGRNMSWEGWEKKDEKWVKNGNGIIDLREKLRYNIKKK